MLVPPCFEGEGAAVSIAVIVIAFIRNAAARAEPSIRCGAAPLESGERRELLGAVRLSSIFIVLVTVFGIRVAMRMGVPSSIRMLMLMFVKHDLQAPPERLSDPA